MKATPLPSAVCTLKHVRFEARRPRVGEQAVDNDPFRSISWIFLDFDLNCHAQAGLTWLSKHLDPPTLTRRHSFQTWARRIASIESLAVATFCSCSTAGQACWRCDLSRAATGFSHQRCKHRGAPSLLLCNVWCADVKSSRARNLRRLCANPCHLWVQARYF